MRYIDDINNMPENMDILNKIDDIKDALFYRELNAKLIREIRELKADIRHDQKVCEDYDDALIKEINKLKAENKQLTQTIKYSNGNDGLYDEVVESNEHLEGVINDLKEENERLKKGFGHGVLVELEQVDSLKEEIESLQDQLKDAVNDYESLLNSNSIK